jgi:hypothetical protein
MKTIITKKYICEICSKIYDTEEKALVCESKPVTPPVPAINDGDKVLITKGPGRSKTGTVDFSYILDGTYGDQYWHSTMLMVTTEDGMGSIGLTYDYYERI